MSCQNCDTKSLKKNLHIFFIEIIGVTLVKKIDFKCTVQ